MVMRSGGWMTAVAGLVLTVAVKRAADKFGLDVAATP
jgi:hypothetical protein